MNLGSDVVITITGIVLVFAILVLLMFIITLEGKIFDNINNKKNGKPAAGSRRGAWGDAGVREHTTPFM